MGLEVSRGGKVTFSPKDKTKLPIVQNFGSMLNSFDGHRLADNFNIHYENCFFRIDIDNLHPTVMKGKCEE